MSISEGSDSIFQNRRCNFRAEHIAQHDDFTRIYSQRRTEGVAESRASLEGNVHHESLLIYARKDLNAIGSVREHIPLLRSDTDALGFPAGSDIPTVNIYRSSPRNCFLVNAGELEGFDILGKHIEIKIGCNRVEDERGLKSLCESHLWNGRQFRAVSNQVCLLLSRNSAGSLAF